MEQVEAQHQNGEIVALLMFCFWLEEMTALQQIF